MYVFSYKIHKVRPESSDILLATSPCGNNRCTHFPDSLRYTNNDKTNATNGHQYSITNSRLGTQIGQRAVGI